MASSHSWQKGKPYFLRIQYDINFFLYIQIFKTQRITETYMICWGSCFINCKKAQTNWQYQKCSKISELALSNKIKVLCYFSPQLGPQKIIYFGTSSKVEMVLLVCKTNKIHILTQKKTCCYRTQASNQTPILNAFLKISCMFTFQL